jgi:hypothetical protein
LFAKRETVGDFHVDILFDEVPEDHETPKTKSLSRNEPSRASRTRTILEASRSLLSQAKSADGGVWRTTDDGSRIFIENGGTVRAGGPQGKVVKRESKGEASDSANPIKAGQQVTIDGAKYVAEPTDGDDSFPPAIAAYELKDGYVLYTGRNGSEGVVAGTKAELAK